MHGGTTHFLTEMLTNLNKQQFLN